MLITDRLRPKHDSVSMDSLLLKEAKGVTKKDKFVLFSLKNVYLASSLLSTIVLGKKKTDRLYTERGITFKSFLYKYANFLQVHNLLLRVNVPEYGYQTYCRSEENFNDFVIMTRHEHDLIERFTPKDGDVVVDVGAHIGLYTIMGSKRVGQNGKVIAIEADPGNFEMLNHNIELNNLTNVIPSNCIAYSKEMEMVLVDYASMLLGENGKPQAREKTVAVHVNTLDNLLQQNGISEVNWIKIDVEGAELEVLKGAHDILSNSKDISVLIEIHGISHLYKPIMEFLNSYNFKIEFEKTYDGRYQLQNMRGAMDILLRKSIYR